MTNEQTKWKDYIGSDEQIAEIVNCETDVLCKYQNGSERLKSQMFVGDWNHKYLTHYLICNPHPLADMIIRQAQTGQPVYVRISKYCIKAGEVDTWLHKDIPDLYITTIPDWNILGAEYSFIPFKEM